MGFCNRRPTTIVPAEVLASLSAYGDAVLRARAAGRPINDSRFDWGSFIGPVHTSLMSGDRHQIVGELYDGALNAEDRGLATIGAYSLLAEFNPQLDDHRFLRLYDEALERMRVAGLSSGHLTRYEADRWIAVHGDLRSSFDGIFEVGVPAAEDLSEPRLLEAGASRMLALTEPLPRGNAFFAEHRVDGKYVIYSERQHSADDPTRGRYEESHLGEFERLDALLRALGEMFGTPPHWYDEDLEPYFPCRRT